MIIPYCLQSLSSPSSAMVVYCKYGCNALVVVQGRTTILKLETLSMSKSR